MSKMGIKAIFPKRNLSKATGEHKRYPYLLKDIKVDCPNRTWASDIVQNTRRDQKGYYAQYK